MSQMASLVRQDTYTEKPDPYVHSRTFHRLSHTHYPTLFIKIAIVLDKPNVLAEVPLVNSRVG